jgi:hypothetical protein
MKNHVQLQTSQCRGLSFHMNNHVQLQTSQFRPRGPHFSYEELHEGPRPAYLEVKRGLRLNTLRKFGPWYGVLRKCFSQYFYMKTNIVNIHLVPRLTHM